MDVQAVATNDEGVLAAAEGAFGALEQILRFQMTAVDVLPRRFHHFSTQLAFKLFLRVVHDLKRKRFYHDGEKTSDVQGRP